jgi:hypothetical protein
MGQCGTGLGLGTHRPDLESGFPRNPPSPVGLGLSTSGSAFDSTNNGGAALDFDMDNGFPNPPRSPFKRHQSYQGIAAVQMQSAAGGLLYDQENDLSPFPRRRKFPRRTATITALGDGSYGFGLFLTRRNAHRDVGARVFAQNHPFGSDVRGLGGHPQNPSGFPIPPNGVWKVPSPKGRTEATTTNNGVLLPGPVFPGTDRHFSSNPPPPSKWACSWPTSTQIINGKPNTQS